MTTTAPAAARRPLTAVRVARTAMVLAALSVASSLLGLLRDLSIARWFGATGATDAFLVAWTVPETATPLLMEGAMAFVLVPLFARELDRSGSLRDIVARTWVPVLGVLALLTVVVAGAAPAIVAVLTPGLADPALAVRCLRAASLTVLFLGTAGYLMAALRSSGSFRLPASVYLGYNIGILACCGLLHVRLGVFSAALGLAVGGLLMVLVQLPVFLRRVPLDRPRLDPASLALFLPFVPVAGYTLGRQAQVLVERVVGSGLTAGTISQLNYAQKVAQVPMLLSITAATVAFPALARAAGRDDRAALGRAITSELRLVVLLIVPAAVVVIALAPQCIAVMFQRGAFTRADTLATASTMRFYALGLLGQSVTSVGALAAYAGGRRTWLPALAALAGLVVTVAVDVPGAHMVGVQALAAGNALGITVVALLMVRALAHGTAPLHLGQLAGHTARVLAAGVAAGLVAVAVAAAMPGAPAVVQLVVSGLAVAVVFVPACLVLGIDEVRALAVRVAGAALTGPVPFAAMYHSVGDPNDDPYDVVLSAERLDAHLRLLRRAGLRGVALRDLYAAQARGQSRGLVGLSFDDGYADFLTAAVPVLERHGCGATVFAVLDLLGGANTWDEGPVRPLMTAEQLRVCVARGFEVASHGRMHRDLREMASADLQDEVTGSREALERVLGEPVVGFCYPYGHVDDAARAAVAAAGYTYGAGVGVPGAGRWQTPRSFLGERDGTARVLAKLLRFRLGAGRSW